MTLVVLLGQLPLTIFSMPTTLVVAVLFWGLLWAGLCIGLCVVPWRARPALLGWAALACVVHVYTLGQLVLPWPVWVHWLGRASAAELREVAGPVPLTWVGKGIGVLCSLGWVYALRRATPAAAGFVRPAPGSARAVAPAVLAAAAFLLGDAHLSRHAFPALSTGQRWLYFVLPGLDEELFYRGALLGLLAPGLARTIPLPGTRTSWGGIAGVLLFTLGHGLGFPDRLFTLGFGADFWRYVGAWWSPTHFPLSHVLFQLSMGTLFLYVRERTGSAWAAAAVHCLLNGCLAVGHSAG